MNSDTCGGAVGGGLGTEECQMGPTTTSVLSKMAPPATGTVVQHAGGRLVAGGFVASWEEGSKGWAAAGGVACSC